MGTNDIKKENQFILSTSKRNLSGYLFYISFLLLWRPMPSCENRQAGMMMIMTGCIIKAQFETLDIQSRNLKKKETICITLII